MPWPNYLIFLLCLFLCACGFQLRGQQTLPFRNLYISAASGSSLAPELGRYIAASSDVKLVDTPDQAQATLSIIQEIKDKEILSLNSSGRVREFQLRYRVIFRVADTRGLNFVPRDEIVLRRVFQFNDTQVLAKENEENLLYRDMQSDMVRQILRRLAAAKIPSQVQ